MAARLADLPTPDPTPDGVEVEEVDAERSDGLINLIAWRYSLPPDAAMTLRSIITNAGFGAPGSPNRGWVARRDGEVISKVVLHLGAGAAGIYGVATRLEARGLGLARTLTLLALSEARATGMEIGVLHSTPMAVSLYKSMGFETVAEFRLFAEPGTLHL